MSAAAAKGRTAEPPLARALRLVREHQTLLVPVGFVFMLAVILVPVPPPAMDVLITINIALGVTVLLTTLHIVSPLDFSVFPSLLLATTLLRLVLNVASTRLILTADASSPEEAMGVAGRVISTFGTFVAGGSLWVGVIIFMILMIVQFMVVTKGAGRIGEVAARFTLDAMPGRQMAIDSDLNAGLIDEKQAKERREEIQREADFFGAMDGASKFVKGDAIAGMIIIVINVAGGFAVGMIERGWPAGQTARVFTILTIGDGLTSQIPSLVISIASAMIVTQAGQKSEFGQELTEQLTRQPRGLLITAGFLGVLSLTPLPTLPLLTIGGIIAGGACLLLRAQGKKTRAEAQAGEPSSASPEPPPVEDLLKVDVLELEVGYGLVRLVDKNQGGDLLDRITSVRRQLAVELGVVMPPVRIRDNMQLEPNTYRLKVRGSPVAEAAVQPGRLLAMDSGIASGKLRGEQTKEPAFGLDAWWIDPNQRQRAETMNYTVVDPTSVMATHLTELVKKHAAELLTREEVSNLVEGLKKDKAPKLVEEVIPDAVKLGELQKVLQNLLRERVPIRDMETIIETLGDWAGKTSDLDVLTEYARHALRRSICRQHATPQEDGRLRLVCVTLDPSFEDVVGGYIDRGPAGTSVNMPARVATALTQQVASQLKGLAAAGHPPVIVASPQVRAVVRQIIAPTLPDAAVLGYNEVADDVDVESIGLVKPPQTAAAAAA